MSPLNKKRLLSSEEPFDWQVYNVYRLLSRWMHPTSWVTAYIVRTCSFGFYTLCEPILIKINESLTSLRSMFVLCQGTYAPIIRLCLQLSIPYRPPLPTFRLKLSCIVTKRLPTTHPPGYNYCTLNKNRSRTGAARGNVVRWWDKKDRTQDETR